MLNRIWWMKPFCCPFLKSRWMSNANLYAKWADIFEKDIDFINVLKRIFEIENMI